MCVEGLLLFEGGGGSYHMEGGRGMNGKGGHLT